MGLAAPKKKIKLSLDPNNKKWTNNTESFGLKIMTSQGWKQGDYLGAKNSGRAEFYTAANSCPIRVSIKDDNLGLGAKVGSGIGPGECTGLDAFKNLLGRLNGKGQDEIEKEQKARDDIRRAIYTEKRWGSMRFVSAGFLIGDQIQNLIDAEAQRARELGNGENPLSETISDDHSKIHTNHEAKIIKESKKKKKLKHRIIETSTENSSDENQKKRKRDLYTTEIEDIKTSDEPEISIEVKKAHRAELKKELSNHRAEDKKSKKKKKKKDEKEKINSKEMDYTIEDSSGVSIKKKRKKEKITKKFDKYAEQSALKVSEPSTGVQKSSLPLTSSVFETECSKHVIQGRHALRARNIAQKRLASMDVAALNQIFMIKA